MNQNMTPNRPPQRPPQRQMGTPQGQQRPPMQRPPQKKSSRYGTAFVAVLITTVALLVLSLIVLCVVLAVGGFDKKPAGEPSNDGGGQKVPEAVSDSIHKPISSTTIKLKTGITLPCSTKEGNYSYPSATATDISNDGMIQSTAAALIDVTNGRAVANKNGSETVYPASMTKVMTLLIACENAKDPTALLTVTEEMVTKYKNSYTPPEKGPSLATEKWMAGMQVTVEDALYMVIYKSDTYACWLLADYIAGNESAFVQMMNDRASAFGLSGTHFENCTGLYHDNHYTTCFDMATIMAVAMNNATAQTILTTYASYTADLYMDGVWKSSVSMFSGWYTGRLEQYRYGQAAAYYAGNGSDIRLIAGKTGYETIPKCCFVTAGKNDETGTLFVCVQVGGANEKESTDDTREIYQKYANY